MGNNPSYPASKSGNSSRSTNTGGKNNGAEPLLQKKKEEADTAANSKSKETPLSPAASKTESQTEKVNVGTSGTQKAKASAVVSKEVGDDGISTTAKTRASNETKPAAILPSTKTKKQQQNKPKPANKVGKADWRRDSLIFGGFLVFMALVSYLNSDVGIQKEDEYVDDGNGNMVKKKKAPTVAELRRAKTLITEQYLEKHKEALPFDEYGDVSPRYDCKNFVGPSSLPRAGWGIVVGTNYTAGEQIPISQGESWNTNMLLSSSSSSSYNEETTVIPSYLMLVKPHQFLHNVELKIDPKKDECSDNDMIHSFKLIATTDITVGQELFMDPESINKLTSHNINNHNLPTVDHFGRADTIIQSFRRRFRLTNSRTVEKRRLNDIDRALVSLYEALSMYDQTTARLLPTKTTDMLLKYKSGHSSSAFQGLKNYTHSSIALFGYCWSDIVIQPKDLEGDDNDDTTSHQVLSTGLVRKGDHVSHVPLYVVDTRTKQIDSPSNEFTCSDRNDDGSGSNDYQTILSVSFMLPSKHCINLSHLDVAVCPVNPIIEVSTDPTIANVEYRDGTRGPHGIQQVVSSIDLLSPILPVATDDTTSSSDSDNDSGTILETRRKQLLDEHSFSLSWDVIALKDIEKGEKIVLLLDHASSIGQLFPNQNPIEQQEEATSES